MLHNLSLHERTNDMRWFWRTVDLCALAASAAFGGAYPKQRIETATAMRVLHLSRSVIVVDKPAGLRSVPGYGPTQAMRDEHARRLAAGESIESLKAEFECGRRRDRRRMVAESHPDLPWQIRERAHCLPNTKHKFYKYCVSSAGGFMDPDDALKAWDVLRKAVAEAEAADGMEDSDSVMTRLRQFYPDVCPVHRLDKPTSGVLAIALDSESASFLAPQWASREVTKEYTALVSGIVGEDSGTIDFSLMKVPPPTKRSGIPSSMKVVEKGTAGSKECLTSFTVRDRFPPGTAPPESRQHVYEGSTLVDLVPHTGRLHQLRVHCAHMGHPILGDRMYADEGDCDDRRLCLHASRLVFRDPDGGSLCDIRSSAENVDWNARIELEDYEKTVA